VQVETHEFEKFFESSTVGLMTGPPMVGVLGSELDPTSDTYGTWAGKKLSNLEEFLHLRATYVNDDKAFAVFRRTATSGYRTGCDAQYDQVHPDTGHMLARMENSVWGRAVLEGSFHLAKGVDTFGSPMVFTLGRHEAMSPDLFSGLYKLTLMLESFGRFGPVPGQSELPKPGDLYAGPGLMPLLHNWDIVEVGAGPGFFAATLVYALNARSYSILDLPTQQAMQYKVLMHALPHEKVDSTFIFVPCCTRQLLKDFLLPSYDLFVSHSALAELTSKMRERYFYHFMIKSKRGFVIDNYEDIHQKRKGGVNDDPTENDDGRFAGLDLVWRLQDLGFDAQIRTHQELLGTQHHRSRAVVITWASGGMDKMVLQEGGRT
ncbi:unnamed protein product, partial [Polarella glacialis]